MKLKAITLNAEWFYSTKQASGVILS